MRIYHDVSPGLLDIFKDSDNDRSNEPPEHLEEEHFCKECGSKLEFCGYISHYGAHDDTGMMPPCLEPIYTCQCFSTNPEGFDWYYGFVSHVRIHILDPIYPGDPGWDNCQGLIIGRERYH